MCKCSKNYLSPWKNMASNFPVYVLKYGKHLHIRTECPRLLLNRNPVAWGTRRRALGTWIFHCNTLHFIWWVPKFSAFSSEGPFKIFLGSSLDVYQVLIKGQSRYWLTWLNSFKFNFLTWGQLESLSPNMFFSTLYIPMLCVFLVTTLLPFISQMLCRNHLN